MSALIGTGLVLITTSVAIGAGLGLVLYRALNGRWTP